MLLKMFRWITKSRLHTALAMLFFIIVPFLIEGLNTTLRVLPVIPINEIISLFTGLFGLVGTTSIIILAWRVDRRAAKESDLKMTQLQQQIVELERKLKASESKSLDEKEPS